MERRPSPFAFRTIWIATAVFSRNFPNTLTSPSRPPVTGIGSSTRWNAPSTSRISPMRWKRKSALAKRTRAIPSTPAVSLCCCAAARFQKCGFLPAPLRDQRELLRTRMALRDLRTALKHRIGASIDRYNLHSQSFSDLFGLRGREYLSTCLAKLPPVTASMIVVQLDALDQLESKIEALEKRIRTEIACTPAVQRLMTLPGVGETLGPVLAFEIGDVARFSRAECLASYAGLVPRLISSGDHVRHGRTPEKKSIPFSSGPSSKPPFAPCILPARATRT